MLVHRERLELSWIAPPAPKAGAYTNSATWARLVVLRSVRRADFRFGRRLRLLALLAGR